ncbi:MAG: hypothetical protein AAF657_08880 [Acidobacteriota bacterium]
MSSSSEKIRKTLQAYAPQVTDFHRGVASARDPGNSAALEGGRAVTTLRSEWLHETCSVCAHTFRTGDVVQLLPGGSAAHDSSELPCHGGQRAEQQASKDLSEFFRGLDHAWPPPPDMNIVRLEGKSPLELRLLAGPMGPLGRRTCAVCSHTLRRNDSVILCPCSPRTPVCEVAIHRDPVHGLHCWNDWNPGARKTYCPATSRLIDE